MAGLSDTVTHYKAKEGMKPSFALVRVTGLEPAHRKIPDPKSGASANSAIPANEMSGCGGIIPRIPANDIYSMILACDPKSLASAHQGFALLAS